MTKNKENIEEMRESYYSNELISSPFIIRSTKLHILAPLKLLNQFPGPFNLRLNPTQRVILPTSKLSLSLMLHSPQPLKIPPTS